MPSTTRDYEALPSETTSISQSLSQRDSQLHREKADHPKASPNTKLLRSAYVSHLWVSWKWESAACVLVLATPIIIFATLHPHNGQPLPQWPFKISINSLLSVYALVLKAVIGFVITSCIGQLQWTWFSETRPLADMLHFDSATRGADGALGLIWRQRFRQPSTSLGCLILVLAVAIDPFVQQLVRPVDCSVEQSGGEAIATLPRANVFAWPYYSYLANTTESPDPETYENHLKQVEDLLHETMYSRGKSLTWQCSTGNCTFPETYGSIGICYTCQDTSTDVTFNTTCLHTDSSYASHHPTSSVDCPGNWTDTLTSNYTDDKHGIVLGTNMKFPDFFDHPTIIAHANTTLPSFLDDPGRSLYFGFLMGATADSGGRADWTTDFTDDSTCDSEESVRNWGCRGYGAATCSLQPCVQIYNATITAGNLEEHLTESSSDTPWGTVHDQHGAGISYLALLDTHCSAKIQMPTKSDATMESRWLPYNLTISDESPLPEDAVSLLENGCLYISESDSVLDYASQYLRGTVEATAVGSYSFDMDVGPSVVEKIQVASMSDLKGPELILSIYNWGHTDFGRVQSIIANVSKALTAYIRTHGGSPDFPGSISFSRDVHGLAHHYATCLEIQWPWLMFPTSLAILTTLFFLMVIGTTNRQGTPIWKTLPLAWVLRAERSSLGLYSSSNGSCEAMKERSAQIAVHLVDEDSDGPRIRMADLKDPNML